MKKKRTALFHSAISLLLCVSMLVGTTFAWFTDSVSTGINTIAAGNLDVELYHSNAAVTNERVDSGTKLFMDLQGDPILWEPGVVSYENLRITNEGDLALAYQLAIATDKENYIVDPETGAQYGLSQILKVGFVENGITATDRAGVVASVKETDWTTLANFLRNGSLLPEGNGESEKTWGVVVYWEPGENDNRWNLNNGKTLNEGDVLSIDLGIRLIATQEVYESDSFGNDYDTEAKAFTFPNFVGGSASATIDVNDQGQTVADVTMVAGKINVLVPAGVQVKAGVTELSVSVSELNASDANISLGENEDKLSLDVHIEGVSADNTVPIIIDLGVVMPTGLNMGNYQLYHVEQGQTNPMTYVDDEADVVAHNDFFYDPATGRVVVAMATFSELTLVADSVNPWNGEVDYSWYTDPSAPYIIANADQLYAFARIVGGMDGHARDDFDGKTVKLTNDVNLNDAEDKNTDKIFYPIGYYYNGDSSAPSSSVYSFKGTFDGAGHTISNFYQNTWEIKGDYDDNYYKDGMGLFGYVLNGKVCNLTVDRFSSDGEFTPTGVIAAYAANSSFENIAITRCNPRVYNTGNGGIIGIAGNSNDNGTQITLKNITVDKSNKISALWGSWDVACGGLVGMFRGNADGGNGKIHFENCHVAAQIDVNNDVCANYQYYAYRYAGMIIGSIRHNTTNAAGQSIPNMAGISASGCTINYGDWNDYYYCELVNNSIASYTHDYQFSRLTKVDVLPDSASGTAHYYVKNSDGTVTCRHFINGKLHKHSDSGTEIVDGKTVDVENNVCVYLPFDQMFTGYGWGVNSQSIDELDGITIHIVESEQNESIPKFGIALENADSYLYRVGNGNAVEIGKLFKALDGVTINGSSVVVSVSPRDPANLSVTGTYTPNTTDWTKGTLKFSGTGVVTLTIQDYQYCTPTVLEVEVVNGNNITGTQTTLSNGSVVNQISSLGSGNAVLLNDVYLVSGGALSISGSTLFGNGFEIDVTAGRTTDGAISNNYLVNLASSVLDNVSIVGAVYTKYGGSASAEYNNPVVLSTGNSVILNSYISNCASPVRVRDGNLEIVNTTLKGGNYANLDIRSGQIVLDNVTTINQVNGNDKAADGSVVVGLGVAVYNADVPDTTTIEIKNGINQYNFISKAQATEYLKDANAKTLMNTVFGNSGLSHLRYTDSSNVLWVNTGILSMTEAVGDDNITDVPGYVDGYATLNGTEGYVHTKRPTAEDIAANVPVTGSGDQGSIAPTLKFDFKTKNYSPKTDGSNDYCYEENGTVNISMDEGDTFSWDPSILTVTKNGKNLDYTVSMNGTDYTGKSIAFNTNGKYTVTYTYTDPNNYGVDAEGNVGTYPKLYSKTLHISVNVVKAAWKSAEIKVNNTAMSGIYVMSGDYDYSYKMKFLDCVTITDYDKDGNASNVDLSSGIESTAFESYDAEGKTSNPGKFDHDNGVITVTYSNGNVLTVSIGAWDGSGPSTKTCSVKTNDGVYLITDGASNAANTGVTWKITGYTYTGNNDAKVTNATTVTFTWDTNSEGYNSKSSGGCFTPDTLVTLADGTQKRVDQLTFADRILAWDFFTGSYIEKEISLLVNHGEGTYKIANLQFSDGTMLRIIAEHGVFDYDLNKYVYFTVDNMHEYIGHRFVQYAEDGRYNLVTLTNAFETEEYTSAWSVTSADSSNAFASGLLTVAPPEDFYNWIEMDGKLVYDVEQFQEDVQTYGLYTYDDFKDYVTYEQFVAWNGAYLKVAVEKGYFTFDYILELIELYKGWMPNN